MLAAEPVPDSVTLIQPSAGWRFLDLPELWAYHEVIAYLVWRDLKVRYRQTMLGVLWVVIQPLAAMAVFSLFLGKLVGVPSDGVPYPLFVLAGLVPWTFFSRGLATGASSLLSNEDLVKKVYFPRLAIPIATVLSGLADLGLGLLLLLAATLFYGIAPSIWGLLWLPAFVLLAAVGALGGSLILAAANVRYRDVVHITPFLVQLLMFLTPVMYPSSLLTEPWRTLYSLNPAVGLVEGARWCLLGVAAPWPMLLISALCAAALFVGGVFVFRRAERTFADLI
jgi:lipopolysaccharide transport system permease protein